MKLSEKMTARLVALLGETAHEYVAKKNQPTYAALERRGLIEWGERRIGSSYSIRLTDAGRALAEELRGDQAETAPGEDEDDYANVMFPADMARVRAAYPVGTHVTGTNRRGERASGTITGYAQSGSPRDGYSTAVEIESADVTGAYTLIDANDVDDETPAEGRVTVHQGAGRGVAPKHADNEDAREAVRVLEAAGHTPATITKEGGDGAGCRCVPRGEGAVYVYHLVDGADRRPDGEYWDIQLDAYARSLRAAGWVTLTPRGRCVRAMRPGTPAGDVHGAQAPAPALPRRIPGTR